MMAQSNAKKTYTLPSLRALHKAGRSNPVVNFNFIFKQLKILSGLLRSARNDDNILFLKQKIYKATHSTMPTRGEVIIHYENPSPLVGEGAPQGRVRGIK